MGKGNARDMENWDMEKLVKSADLMGLRNHQKGRLGRIQLSMEKMLRSLQRGQKSMFLGSLTMNVAKSHQNKGNTATG